MVANGSRSVNSAHIVVMIYSLAVVCMIMSLCLVSILFQTLLS